MAITATLSVNPSTIQLPDADAVTVTCVVTNGEASTVYLKQVTPTISGGSATAGQAGGPWPKSVAAGASVTVTWGVAFPAAGTYSLGAVVSDIYGTLTANPTPVTVTVASQVYPVPTVGPFTGDSSAGVAVATGTSTQVSLADWMAIVKQAEDGTLPVTATDGVTPHPLADWMKPVERMTDWVMLPTSQPTATAGSAGALTGTYYYSVTYVTSDGETEGCVPSGAVTVSSQRINLTGIPVSGDSRVIARKIYRTPAGAADSVLAQYVATISDNTTTTYTDNLADGTLGAAVPKSNTTGGYVDLNGDTVASTGAYTTRYGFNAHPGNTGYANSAFGSNAMLNNTTGYRNCAFGIDALFSNTTGKENNGFGVHALNDCTTGGSNTAVGYASLFSSNGSGNVAVGSRAMESATTGVGNVAVGQNAAQFATTAQYMVAVGSGAMQAPGTGTGNVAVGASCMPSMTDGNFNVAMGFGSAGLLTTGSTNTAVGLFSLATCATGSGNVALGSGAGRYETGDNHLWIDNQPRTNLADGQAKALIYGTFSTTAAAQLLRINGLLQLGYVPTYADNTAAKAGGLVDGQVYRTSTGVLMVVYT